MPKEKKDESDNLKYWLIKGEAASRMVNGKDVKFDIDDLRQLHRDCWNGVRNYEARNNMKKMKIGDICFFYHSNCKQPGIAGLCSVVRENYVDHTQFDPDDIYYDPKASKDNPKWFMVDVQFEKKFETLISLKTLQELKDTDLKGMFLLSRGRLSVQPVEKKYFDFIMTLTI